MCYILYVYAYTIYSIYTIYAYTIYIYTQGLVPSFAIVTLCQLE